MRAPLTAIAMVLGSIAAKAEEFRTWTDADTNRKIEAKMVQKDDKERTVTLILKSLKTVEIDVSRLIEEDQKFIKEWEKDITPADQLTVRVVKSGISRGKRVEVDVKSGKIATTVSGGCNAGCHRLRETVNAGERGLFRIEVHDKYTFTLTDAKGNFVDRETALRKTGKTESR